MNGLEGNDNQSDFTLDIDDHNGPITLDTSMTARDIHDKLANDSVRIFALRIRCGNKKETSHWIHYNKTVPQWRDDLRQFITVSFRMDDQGWACSEVWNGLFSHLNKLGYHAIDDVVSDVFEGRITNNAARLIDDPAHEDQKDGFGHYGWDSK